MLRSEGTWARRSWLHLGIALAAIAVPAAAQRAPLFKSEIMPVLQKNCVMCHSEQQKMAGLYLSSFSGMMAGSSRGPGIAPGQPERTMLWKRVEKGQKTHGRQLHAAPEQHLPSSPHAGR